MYRSTLEDLGHCSRLFSARTLWVNVVLGRDEHQHVGVRKLSQHATSFPTPPLATHAPLQCHNTGPQGPLATRTLP